VLVHLPCLAQRVLGSNQHDTDLVQAHPTVWPDNGIAHALTKAQLESFDRDGFLILKDMFTEDEVREMQKTVERLRLDAEAGPEGGNVIFEPNTHYVRSLFAPHKEDHIVGRTCRSDKVVNVAKTILQDDVYIHQSRINFQRAFVGTGFYWHSDFETWHAEDGMPLPRCFSTIIPLSRNVAANGALMVIPGSHKKFIRCPGEVPEENWNSSLKEQQSTGVPDHSSFKRLAAECGEPVHLEGEPGSMIIFDCNLMHGSHSNISHFDRCNVFFVFNALSNKLDAPFAKSPSQRPERIAVRDPKWVQPL